MLYYFLGILSGIALSLTVRLLFGCPRPKPKQVSYDDFVRY